MRCCRTCAAARRGFPGGADGLAGQGRAEPVAGGDFLVTAELGGEYARWRQRDLSARRSVYVWADGVFLQVRMEDHGKCMLALIGAKPEGKKELIGFKVHYVQFGNQRVSCVAVTSDN